MSTPPKPHPTPSNGDRALLSGAGSYRWVVLGIALTAQMTASLLYQGAYILVPFWQSAYHLSQAAAALAVSAMSAGTILLMVPLGLAIDRYGERGVVALTMVAMGVAAISAALFASTSYPLLLFLLTGLGACYGAVQPGGTRAIMRWFPQELRGTAIGVRQAGLPLGTALAAIMLPVLAVKFGWTVAICVAGGIAIAGGMLFGVFHQDSVGQSASGTPSAPPSFRELINILAKVPALWPVLIAGLAMVSFQSAFFAHVLIYLTSLEIPIVAAGFFFALAQGAGIGGRIVLPWISDHLWAGKRIRSLRWTTFACGLAIVALMLLPTQPPSGLLVTIFAVLGLFGIGWYSLWLVEVAEMAPRTAVASTISFAMTLNQIGITLMPLIFGLVVDLAGYQSAWTLVVVILVLAALQLRHSTRLP